MKKKSSEDDFIYCLNYCQAMSNIEQVLKTTLRKAAAIRPPTIHHGNSQN